LDWRTIERCRRREKPGGKILVENFLTEKFLVGKIPIEKIPDGKVPIYRKKCVEKIPAGKIPGELFPTSRKNFGEKILDGKFPVGKILGENFPGEFFPVAAGTKTSRKFPTGFSRLEFSCREISRRVYSRRSAVLRLQIRYRKASNFCPVSST